MIKRSVCLILILSGVAIGSAQQTDREESRFEAVVHYWEWASYFGYGLELPYTKYQPGKSFEALIFFEKLPDDLAPGDASDWSSSAYWGFCSAQLGACHAYGGPGYGTVTQVNGMKIKKGETEEQALERFRKTNFWDDEFGPPEPPTILVPQQPPPRSTAQPGTGAAAISLTAPPLPLNAERFDIQTRHGQIRLPKLDLPIAARQKISNRMAERAAREELYNPDGGCTLTVPYADERAAAIPILVECPDGAEITYATKGPFESYHFSHGGLVEDKATIDRLAPRIRSNASLVLKEGAAGR